jgi:hypothetical protein
VSAQLVSSPPFLFSGVVSLPADVTTPCHASFPLSQDELAASVSSFDNTLSHRLLPRAKTEVLNPHHRRRPLFSDRLTLTCHYNKKVISTLITLSTTQSHLYFAFSLARAPHRRSSIRHHHFLSLLSHVHRPFT